MIGTPDGWFEAALHWDYWGLGVSAFFGQKGWRTDLSMEPPHFHVALGPFSLSLRRVGNGEP